MKNGDKVRIVKCEVCPKIVGKEVRIVEVRESSALYPTGGVKVNFGRGRPQLNRPEVFPIDDIALAEDVQKDVVLIADQQDE